MTFNKRFWTKRLLAVADRLGSGAGFTFSVRDRQHGTGKGVHSHSSPPKPVSIPDTLFPLFGRPQKRAGGGHGGDWRQLFFLRGKGSGVGWGAGGIGRAGKKKRKKVLTSSGKCVIIGLGG